MPPASPCACDTHTLSLFPSWSTLRLRSSQRGNPVPSQVAQGFVIRLGSLPTELTGCPNLSFFRFSMTNLIAHTLNYFFCHSIARVFYHPMVVGCINGRDLKGNPLCRPTAYAVERMPQAAAACDSVHKLLLVMTIMGSSVLTASTPPACTVGK